MRPAVTAALALGLAACADQAAVHTTSAKLPNEGAQQQLEFPSDATIKLRPDVYESCRNVPAKFGWEKPDTSVEWKAQLAALATCLNHPGMEDRHVLLVGNEAESYADGMRRAHEIKTYLVGVGLAADRIDVSSVGEVAAKNVDVMITDGARP